MTTAMLIARRALPSVAAAAGLGFGTAYAVGPTARDDELPRQWDREAVAAYWKARPLAAASRALEVAATLAPVAARIAADRAFVAADEPTLCLRISNGFKGGTDGFPWLPAMSADCRALISALLVKSPPENRLRAHQVLEHRWVAPTSIDSLTTH